MDERKQRILHAIIQDYIRSAEPVGSRTLAKNYNLGISPATVRNEMSDLEELGFLEQPHTSAGRIPSAKGYRYYVDSMIHGTDTERGDAEEIHRLWQAKAGNFDEFFLNVAKLISNISHNMSLFLAPAHDSSLIKFIHILPIGSQRAVMVVVTDRGALDNEPMHFDEGITREELESTAIRFANALKDSPISELSPYSLKAMIQVVEGPKRLLEEMALALHRAIAKRKLFYSVGTTALLEQPEFKDIKKVQPILSMIEQQDQLNQLLQGKPGRGIDIRIGEENEAEPLKDLSLIQADFGGANNKIGTLAILGPTRMEYKRIIGILTYMQQFIEALSTSTNRK